MKSIDTVYDELKESIEDAKLHHFLDDTSGLIMLGRISFAYERGDITYDESDALKTSIFPDYRTKYARAIQIANTGIPDEALEHTT